MTADSTINVSHFHGALSAPATTASSSVSAPSAGRGSPSPGRSSAPADSGNGNISSCGTTTSGTCCVSSSCGTWASERYSAKRRAESFSHAHARMATKARPAGCGRRVPRSNQAGTPARVSACSSSADVPLRRADEDRHIVERHAAASLLQDPARDLDRFATFAWRGEELDVAAWLAFRRLRRGEQIAPQRDEIVVSLLLQNLGQKAHRLQAIQRGGISERYGDEDVRTTGAVPRMRSDQRLDEGRLHGRFERHVEQQQRLGLPGPGVVERADGGVEQPRPIGGRRRGELLIESLQQRRQIATAEWERRESMARHVREAQFLQCTGERAREAGRPRDWLRSTTARPRAGPRMLLAPIPPRIRAASREPVPRPPGSERRGERQLCEAEAMQADGGAGAGGDGSGEIVHGTT